MNLGLLDALHAIGALFHDASHADRDVRILLKLRQVSRILRQLLRPERTFVVVAVDALVEIKEVEAANLIWAVVRAIAGTDTTVVRHGVETLVVMDGGVGGADGLARGGFAMLAGDTHKRDLRVFRDGVAGLLAAVEEVAVQADPMHVTSLQHLMAADDRNIILGLTGGHASVATRAGIEIDRHPPLLELQFGFMPLPDRYVRRGPMIRMFVGRITARGGAGFVGRRHRTVLAVNGGCVSVDAQLGEGLVFLHVLDTALTDDVAAFHRPVILHIADRDSALGNFDLSPRAEGGRRAADKTIDVETIASDATGETFIDARGDAAGDRATEAELHTDRIIGEARHDEDRTLNGIAVDGKFGDVADQATGVELVDITVKRTDLVDDHLRWLDREFSGQLRADENDILPAGLRHRIRGLGEPAVIGIGAIAGVHARQDAYFQRIKRESRGGERLDLLGADGRLGGGEFGMGEHALGEPGGEGFVGGTLRERVERLADERVGVFIGTGERRENVEFGDRREKRVNHRLDGHVGAVDGTAIRPAFEVMRGGEDGSTGSLNQRRGLVERGTEVTEANDLFRGLHSFDEFRVGRSVVGGVATKNDQRVGRLGGKRRDRQRGSRRGGDILDRGTKGLVREEDRAMSVRREVIASDDESGPFRLHEIGDAFLDPMFVDGDAGDFGLQRGTRRVVTRLGENFGGKKRGERGNMGGRSTETVIGGGAGQREGRFDDVESGHLLSLFSAVGASGGGVGAGVFDSRVVHAQEITVKAQDAASFRIIRQHARTEDGFRAILGDGSVFNPAGLRIDGLKTSHKAGAGRRRRRTGQESKTSAGIGFRGSG